MDTIQEHLTELILTATEQLGLGEVGTVTLEHPADPQFGEFSTNVAMQIFKQVAGQQTEFAQPRQLAQALAETIQTLAADRTPRWVESVAVAGPGFINFQLTDTFFVTQLAQAQVAPQNYLPNLGQGKPVVVEYSSPNIAKPFTIGHLRSTIIGDAVANILAAVGYQVFRDNHLGDWGTQFGKQIYALIHFGEGSLEKNLAKISASPQPVKELVQLYVEFHQKAETDPTIEEAGREWFKKLEDGDPQARELWQQCIMWSLKEFQGIYERLGVHFTENDGRGYGESFFEDKMAPVIAELEQLGLVQESEGAKLIFFPNDTYPPLMIVKKDGSTLYATRDLATDKFRFGKYGSDVTIINEVGAEQALYFKQLYETEVLAGWCQPQQRVHVKHGLYRFKEGKMSTRKGNVIWLEDVLNEAVQRAGELAQSKGALTTAEIEAIGLGALKWNDLKRSSHLDITFDWDEVLNLKGNSGPYLQYVWVRCQSVLAKATQQGMSNSSITNYLDTLVNNKEAFDNKLNAEEKDVLRYVYRYFDAVALAAREYAPHHLCTYLYQLTQSYNTFYNAHSILGVPAGEMSAPKVALTTEQKMLRLALTQATAQIVAHGLSVLGIQTVTRM